MNNTFFAQKQENYTSLPWRVISHYLLFIFYLNYNLLPFSCRVVHHSFYMFYLLF